MVIAKLAIVGSRRHLIGGDGLDTSVGGTSWLGWTSAAAIVLVRCWNCYLHGLDGTATAGTAKRFTADHFAVFSGATRMLNTESVNRVGDAMLTEVDFPRLVPGPRAEQAALAVMTSSCVGSGRHGSTDQS